MPIKIFVGQLGNGARPEELRRLFEGFGNVVECDIVNRCGFVHMSDDQEADAAIKNLNNTLFNGQTISVEYGRQKERNGGDGNRSIRSSAPYERNNLGFNRDMAGRSGYRTEFQGGRERGGGGYQRDRPEDSYYSSGGEDRRGFALPERNDSYRRGGDENYRREGYSGEGRYGRDSGPIRRTGNYHRGDDREGIRSQYQNDYSSDRNRRSEGHGYGNREGGGGSYGYSNNDRYSNHNAYPSREGRGGSGGGIWDGNRGPPQQRRF